jgi:hypothetical protein
MVGFWRQGVPSCEHSYSVSAIEQGDRIGRRESLTLAKRERTDYLCNRRRHFGKFYHWDEENVPCKEFELYLACHICDNNGCYLEV